MRDEMTSATESANEAVPDETPPTTPATAVKQYNKHDAKAAEARCQTLLRAISDHGAQVDVRGMVREANFQALARLLVQAGLVNEDQLEAERLTIVEQSLQAVLVEVEEQKLQRSGKKVQPVHHPPLAVARR